MAYAPSRWPATAVFFLNGLLLSSYIVRVPALKTGLNLSTAQLGLAGTLFAISAILAMQFVGAAVARFDATRVIRVTLLVMPVAVALIGLSRSMFAFAVATMLTGAVHGTLDVAMNAYAVAVERAIGRPILSGCHAAWSISAVVASSAGAALIRAGVPTAAHLLAIAVVVGVAGLAVRLTPIPSSATDSGQRRTARWTRRDVLFGLTGTVLMICEGAALTWMGVYLHDDRSATLATASLAVTAYTASQTAGRLVGDRLSQRIGAGTLFRLGGLLGTAALAVALLVRAPAAAIVALGLAGLATSNMIPTAFGAAGRTRGPDEAAVAVSRFTTFTYSGILAGPAIIGWIAQGAGLSATMLGLVPLLAVVALAGLPKPAPQPNPAPALESV